MALTKTAKIVLVVVVLVIVIIAVIVPVILTGEMSERSDDTGNTSARFETKTENDILDSKLKNIFHFTLKILHKLKLDYVP